MAVRNTQWSKLFQVVGDDGAGEEAAQVHGSDEGFRRGERADGKGAGRAMG